MNSPDESTVWSRYDHNPFSRFYPVLITIQKYPYSEPETDDEESFPIVKPQKRVR